MDTLEQLRDALIPAQDAAGLQVPGRTPAAVLVALYVSTDGLRVVLTRRHANLRAHGGEISFPGGRAEPGEDDPRDTALREAEEEIGLPRSSVELLGALQPTATVMTDFAIHPFVGLTQAGRLWQASSSEVTEVLEPTLADLRAGYGRRRVVRRGLTFRTDSYLLGEHLVWGATARILVDLLRRVRIPSDAWPGS